MRRLLAHHIILLWLCLLSALPVLAQSNAQVMADIKFTMKDFMAELTSLNEDKQFFKDNIQLVGSTYASSDYFICNGVRQTSFEAWMTEYCTLHLSGLPVGHTLDILEHSIQKVSTNPNDKRYRFEAVLHRTWSQSNITQDNVTITVVWNGRRKNVSITEWNGRLSDMSTMDGPSLFELAERLISENKISQALDVYKMSANKHYIPARLKLGKKYFQFRQYDNSYNQLKISESSADGEALYMLGWMYEYGKGISKNWIRAHEYYKKSLTLGYYLASESLEKLRRSMRSEGLVFQGKVVDMEDRPINSVSITIKGTDNTILTDYYGSFEMMGLKEGDVLVVSSPLYETLNVTYSRGRSNKFVLKKIPNKPVTSVHYTSDVGGNVSQRVTSRQAGTGICSGTVFDMNGNPVNAAWVSIQGSDKKILTDILGTFKLSGLKQNDVIEISNLGMYKQTVKWTGQKDVNVTLVGYAPFNTSTRQQEYRRTDNRTTSRPKRTFRWCRGVVYKPDGLPANSVTVGIENTDIRVLTDYYGNFELHGLYLDDYIYVYNMGREIKKIKWNGEKFIKIYMDNGR